MDLLGAEGVSVVPFRLKKIYFFTSIAALGLISWAIRYFGETNLPPLIPAVRYIILALYANCFMGYAFFVSDPQIRFEKPSGWVWLAVIGVFLSMMPPVFSGDLMEYLIRGRMLAIYHVSPYQVVPNDFPNDILRPYSIWVTNPDSYGPISVYLQTLPPLLFPTSILGMIWSYKIMVLFFFGLAVLFFWKITRYLNLPNGTQLWAMFAYCPLVIVAALIDGHNDVIMMAFSVVSLYFLARDRYGWSLFFWTCGFLVKYMIVLQLPFMVLVVIKKIWTDKKKFPWLFVVQQAVINVVLVIACFAPVWGGNKTFLAILRQKGAFYTNTIPYLFYWAPKLLGWAVDQQFLKTFFLTLFCVFYIYLLWRCWNKTEGISEQFFRVAGLAYLAFYTALPSPMGYWYLLWAVFWIVLARWRNNLFLVMLYSAVGVVSFYKRINFLAAFAVFVYVISLGWPAISRRVIRQ